MTYDNYGNIVSKNGVAYTYGDEHWKDLLTKYGDKNITYDAQGNPVNYLGHTLTWEKGRQLKKFVKTDGTVIDYTYNANGIRTSKTVNGVKHTYTLDGTKILRETWTKDGVNHSIIPMYDNEDSACGIKYNEVPYYFQKNLQGDIIAIVDKDANAVARYAYDAWGVCTIEEDNSGCNIAEENPYRYRGYYFDAEIGLYYLQSRYYNPVVARFLSIDEATTIGFIYGYNMSFNIFTYCKNDPCNTVDELGLFSLKDIKDFFKKIFDGIVDKIKQYLNSLIVKKGRSVTIKSEVFAAVVDAILYLLLKGYVIKAFNTALTVFKNTYLVRNTHFAVDIMRELIDFVLNNKIAKLIVNLIVGHILKNAGFGNNYIKILVEGMIGDALEARNKLASKVWIVITAFGSAGSILGFILCDLPDGSIDGKLKITW